MRYLGIDPGSRGALCSLNPLTGVTEFIDLTAKDVDIHEWLVFQRVHIARCALEDVHSLPGMAAKSNFGFGKQVGRIQTLLNIMSIEFILVQPKQWQQACDIPPRKELPEGADLKVFVAQKAQGLYPNAALHGPRGGLLDGRSDALMLAHYLTLYPNGE